MASPRLYLLDYGAGNVRSLANSITKLGYEFEWITEPGDFAKADKLIFPGVGAFTTAIENLHAKNLFQPLKEYILSGKPYFGICIGMQVLFRDSLEARDLPSQSSASQGAEYSRMQANSIGLGLIDGEIEKFDSSSKAVPHMGWNDVSFTNKSSLGATTGSGLSTSSSYYFVHSYRATYPSSAAADSPAASSITDWAYTTTQYGDEVFVSSVKKGDIFATQFHPEKSGESGLELLRTWLQSTPSTTPAEPDSERLTLEQLKRPKDGFRKRIVACLDVRANDEGDLVVTKGDQYDVREKEDPSAPQVAGDVSSPSSTQQPIPAKRAVRNLGKPVALTARYFSEGADEICLLNITSFRNSPLRDQPMLAVVREAAAQVFVPLTIGGGIKDTADPDGTKRTALEVAGEYFRAGADKVSIGSEAVIVVERMMDGQGDGSSAIETIARAYGRQAVVVSIDPKRVYIDRGELETYQGRYKDEIIRGLTAVSADEEERDKAWWYQCTVSGGRELRALSVVELARGVERLGAGEILVNSIDRDGTGRGFDLDLIRLIKSSVSIPVVASSGAGNESHFVDVFERTGVEAALAAGIFHRKEVGIGAVKQQCRTAGLTMRM